MKTYTKMLLSALILISTACKAQESVTLMRYFLSMPQHMKPFACKWNAQRILEKYREGNPEEKSMAQQLIDEEIDREDYYNSPDKSNTKIDTLTDNYLRLRTSSISTLEMRLLKTPQGNTLLALNQSVSGPLTHSILKIYNEQWQQQDIEIPNPLSPKSPLPVLEIKMNDSMPTLEMIVVPQAQELMLQNKKTLHYYYLWDGQKFKPLKQKPQLVTYNTTAREEILANPRLSASNYVAYIAPDSIYDQCPKGYEPFYLSHYGRHGSRYLIGPEQYDKPLQLLQRAKDKKQLTPLGEKLLGQLQQIKENATERLGELTPLGEKQHQQIALRMTQRTPQIFMQKNTQINARSTIVPRCLLSMAAGMEVLAAQNPNARLSNDASQSYQYYLNAPKSQRLREEHKIRQKNYEKYKEKQTQKQNIRLWNTLFKNNNYRDSIDTDPQNFQSMLFDIASNQQSHGTQNSLYDLFTPEEIYEQWKKNNIRWYIAYAQGTAPYGQEELLKNIIQTADTIINNNNFHGATLRYGHEVCLMPLAALMELANINNTFSAQELDSLDQHFRNYNIFPMASNIQIIFYRNNTDPKKPILVKTLLNEKPVSMPTTPTIQPYYYEWEKLKQYYTQKIIQYHKQQ